MSAGSLPNCSGFVPLLASVVLPSFVKSNGLPSITALFNTRENTSYSSSVELRAVN